MQKHSLYIGKDEPHPVRIVPSKTDPNKKTCIHFIGRDDTAVREAVRHLIRIGAIPEIPKTFS